MSIVPSLCARENSMEKIRIGLAGLGHRSFGWLRLLQKIDGCRITALCDPIKALHGPALTPVNERSDVFIPMILIRLNP